MYLTIDKKHIILSLVICTILACSIGFVYNNVFAAKGNWGLSFKENGKIPDGNATSDFLKQYNSYYIGDTTQKKVYLTFDAGYENGYMPQILDALKKNNVKATFFVVSTFMKTNPELVKRMVDEGHIVGNHTMTHPNMSKMSTMEDFKSEIEPMEEMYKEITGKDMKKLKTASLIGLSLLLLPFNASAAKTESIYTKLDYNGDTVKSTVSNHIENNKNGEVKDNTILSNILNVNGDETFTLDKDTLTWYAKEKDIFYQGTTDKELPLSTVVKYYYNGKETDAKDIIGKSGKIKIEIRLLNNSLLNKNNKFTPLVVAVGTTIDNETNKNISITNGKVTDTGSRNIAVAISSPGLYEYTNIKEFKDLNKVVISYETTDFEINDIYMVASPKLLSELDFDIFNKLDEFSSSIDTLSSKMDDIENGAKKLYDGSSALVSGEAKFNSKLTYLATSLEKISNGTLALNDGIDEMIETLTSVKEMMANKDLNGSLANLQVLYQTNSATIKKISKIKL